MRVTSGTITRKRHRKWLKLAKGYWGHRSVGFKVAKQAVIKSWTYAFRDRKQLKREFRKLWISRINAAVREHGLSYSRFVYGLKKAEIAINRKMLSELAIHEPETFKLLIDTANQQLN